MELLARRDSFSRHPSHFFLCRIAAGEEKVELAGFDFFVEPPSLFLSSGVRGRDGKPVHPPKYEVRYCAACSPREQSGKASLCVQIMRSSSSPDIMAKRQCCPCRQLNDLSEEELVR